MMLTKQLLIISLSLAISAIAVAQSTSHLSQNEGHDTIAIPSIVELKAQILNLGNTSSSSHVDVPSQHRALFCRFDDKLDRKGIPLRMRLGSLEETNRMEAKPGYRVGQLPH